MKRIAQYISIALLSLIICGCNDLKESAESLTFPETVITLTATRETIDSGTRSFRLDDGSVWWSPKEEVSVFYGSGTGGGSKFVSMNTSIAETVELQGSIQMSGSGKVFWAVYPYSQENSCDGSSITTVIPSTQIGVEGNFSDDAFPAMAKGSSTSLPFWNICGGIKFFVSRNDIKSVTIKGNNNETLVGKVKVAFNQDGKPEVIEVIDGKAEVTLTAPDGAFKVGKYYYITLLPASLNGGFTMTFMTETEIGTFVSNRKQEVKRSTFGLLKNIDAKVTEWKRTVAPIPVPEYVDLGLSVKWATFNVGATKPEEYGDYFAWGELNPKSDYSISTYKYASDYKYTKYWPKNMVDSWGGQGDPDGLTELEPEDDAAHVYLGDIWRMPTDELWLELINNCTWTWTSNYNGTGIAGMEVLSNNGNSIFLPEARYWSSSLSSIPDFAINIGLNPECGFTGEWPRIDGLPIRPVFDDRTHPVSVMLNKPALSLYVGDTEYLSTTVLPDDTTTKTVSWASDNPNVASVDESGKIEAIAGGVAVITATTSDGGLSASCKVTVLLPMPEAVDLGLSVKWAACNLGATKPEECGYYFSWGETGQKTRYLWSEYKHAKGAKYKLTKYCPKNKVDYWGGQGEPDGITELEPEDDVARVILNGDWRMPTRLEWQELCNGCYCSWTPNYNGTGIAGTIVTSGYTNNSIFIPAAGGMKDRTRLVGFLYWSSELRTDSPDNAYIIYSSSSYSHTLSIIYEDRYIGLPIRPVCTK